MSQQPPTSGGAAIVAGASNDASFPTWVRNWIHYEQLASNLYKQAIKAREVRDNYEGQILTSLENRKMLNATLQLKQGKYGFVQETHTSPLSLTNIEGMLHLYFQAKGAQGRNETGEIMAFIKQHRQQTYKYRLKKVNDPAAALPLPPADN
jgi:hypothetical protein